MNFPASTSVATVERGLRSEAARLARTSSGRWSLELTNGASHRLEVQLDGDWLQFTSRGEVSAGATATEALWRAVNRNAGLPAGIKLALSPARLLALRSDLLLADELDVEERVRGVVEAFQRVGRDDPRPAAERTREGLGDLERLCEETGWRSVRRSSGRLTVALEVTPAMQATVTPEGSGVRLCVEVADLCACSSLCRMAAAALALEITSAIRLVRASADADSAKMLFEVLWPEIPAVAELDAGFSSLSAAGRAAGESFSALQNENLASDYVFVRGWSAGVSKPNQEQTTKGQTHDPSTDSPHPGLGRHRPKAG